MSSFVYTSVLFIYFYISLDTHFFFFFCTTVATRRHMASVVRVILALEARVVSPFSLTVLVRLYGD